MYKIPETSFDTVLLKGGWDTDTPILSLASGRARRALNYECSETTGYRRLGGYERFDGQTSPSSALYKLLYIDSFVNIPVVGDTITGDPSTATGVVAAVGPDYIVYTKSVLAFDIGVDVIKVGATVIGNSIAPTGTLTTKQKAIYVAAAADIYRADITAIPGEGIAVGGFLYNDIVYAFRPNVGQTTLLLHKQSAAGWVNVPFYNEVSFDTGDVAIPADGDTLTQGGVTATIKRVVRESGALEWTGDTAGRFIIDTPSGGNFAAGAATIGATTVNLLGVETAITMNIGGKLETDSGNFYGGISTYRIYGADGANRMFEFDGETLVPLNTGTTPDVPKHVQIHNNYLFHSNGASLISSAPGLPYDYTALSGAAIVSIGYNITGLKTLTGSQATSAMLVTSKSDDGVNILYGKTWNDFKLEKFDGGGGAIDYTLQNLEQSYMFDDRGVASMRSSQDYGNFNAATLTKDINQFIVAKRARVSYSTLDNRKGQYRLYFTDGSGLYITIINGELIGSMPITFPNVVHQCFGGEYSDGTDAAFFCTTDGYVMHNEVGTSFDGADIDAFCTLNYNATGSHRQLKRYRKCSLELFGGGYTSVLFGYKLGYGTPLIAQPLSVSYEDAVNLLQWDNFTWDEFTWDGSSDEPMECEMRGTSNNVELTFRSGTNYILPYIINTATLHYTMRRKMR